MRASQITASTRQRCPNESEECRDVDQKTTGGKPNLHGESHSVRTSQEVVVQDGMPALMLTAECSCGWRESVTIRGDD